MEKVLIYPFGADFIENLAEYIFKSFYLPGRDLRKLAFVFGGKRPSLFLKRALGRKIKNSFFPPRFFSIDELVKYILLKKDNFTPVDELEADFLLYELVQKISPGLFKNKTFPDFLSWAREIRSFIEKLDLEDIHDPALTDIQKSVRLGLEAPESVKKLLSHIVKIRKNFHKIILDKKNYTRGLAYLRASQSASQLDFGEFDQIFFCNFFYLNNTEAQIIKSLYQKDRAFLIFQGDPDDWPILKNTVQKLDLSLQRLPHSKPAPKISFFSSSDNIAQAGVIGEILKTIPEKDQTLIVTPEPENIVPILSEISGEVENFNVSMGYPIKRSSLVNLFKFIFEAQLTKKDNQYYVRDYLKLLLHPLVKNLGILGQKETESQTISRILVHKIEELLLGMSPAETADGLAGALFIELKKLQNFSELLTLTAKALKNAGLEITLPELKKCLEAIHQLFFYNWENLANFEELALILKKTTHQLIGSGFLEVFPLNLAAAQKIIEIAEKFEKISFKKEKFSQEGIFKIFGEILDSEMISFSGSPLKGLQILGFWEARSLNFKNVIITDLNESVLPRLKIHEPLIPREILVGLGLGTLEVEEEIQRYNFLRLISSAQNVFLIYEESSQKEKSRWVEELIWAEQKKARSLKAVKPFHAGFKTEVFPEKKMAPKSSQMAAFLKNDFVYSASSLDEYLACPLSFYFKYLLGLREKETFCEEAESSDIGTFIHLLLKEAFGPFQISGSPPLLDKKFENNFWELFEKSFEGTFVRTMKADSFLLKEVMRYRLKRFLESEKERGVKKIINLEKSLKKEISFSSGKYRFKVILDRLDGLADDSCLILDYKTGATANHKPKNLEKIDYSSRLSLKKSLKSFQLPLYFYFLSEEYPALDAALYDLKEPGLKFLFKDEPYLLRKELIAQKFLKALEFMISEIIDEKEKFGADETNVERCERCAYRYLCR